MRPYLIVLLTLCLTDCDDMDHQPRYDSYEKSLLFPDGKSLQAPPEGTISRDDARYQQQLATRPPLTPALLERGHERYQIYCSPCHDAAGYGNGRVVSRGFPHPPSFHGARLRHVAPGYVVDVITHGHGVMYSYADRITPEDRWAIAAYVKALQHSQDAPPSAMSDAMKQADASQPKGTSP